MSTQIVPSPAPGAVERPAASVVRTLLDLTGDEPRVYLMGRIVDYQRPTYAAALAWLAGQMPAATILSARDVWHSSAHWRAGWPVFAPTVDAAVMVTTAPAHFIGRGMLTEMLDLAMIGRPVLWLRADGSGFQLTGDFRTVSAHADDWSRVAQLRVPSDRRRATTAKSTSVGGKPPDGGDGAL